MLNKEVYTVYLITNTINNKQYIGQTNKTTIRRWLGHVATAKRGAGFYFHQTIRKYGQDAFEVVSLYCTLELSHVNSMEMYFIREYDTFQNGYNLTMGGEGNTGWIPSQETRELWSKQRKGKKQSVEFIANRVSKITGKKRTPEQKERYRQSKLGVKRKSFSPEHIENLKIAKRKRDMNAKCK